MINKTAQWTKLLCSNRRKSESKGKTASEQNPDSVPPLARETRTEIERDYDRILFSTPVRRLADKTQVFPLEKNDSVRTRLTHSHEVSNLARSFGTALVFEYKIAEGVENAQRNLPAALAAIGLCHDLGNPPFGHQGESAMQSWFAENETAVLKPLENNLQHALDFKKFEGNAQSFRLVTRLQLLNDDFGLDLTYATLAALMKYPVGSDETNQVCVATKKYGFFASEQPIAMLALKRVGLSVKKRHALAYIMEACDDIAYVVMDIEDAVKKGLASFSDLVAYLQHNEPLDNMVKSVVEKSLKKHEEYRKSSYLLSPAELNDVSMQRFRVEAIGAMIREATQTFVENIDVFIEGTSAEGLMKLSNAERLRKLLKDFGLKYAYTHRSVLTVELQGYNVIRSLMDMFWAAIVDREDCSKPESPRCHPFTKFVYGRISENYRRVFENPSEDLKQLPMRYRECQLLTDMISGMTDSFAMDLCKELQSLKGDFEPHKFLR